jgi:cytochrome c biogenesis protein CcmG/thiol:disulfide interchange protein DsbE
VTDPSPGPHLDVGRLTEPKENGRAPSSESPSRPSGRRSLLAASVGMAAVAIAVVAVMLAGPEAKTPSQLVGKTGAHAPAFSLPSLEEPDRTLSLRDFRGHDLVINFWASWCIPCRTEMPLLQESYRAAHGRIHFLGVDTNDQRSDALRFLRQVHVTYPVAYDPNGSLVPLYHLPGMPTTVFVSATGIVLGTHYGQFSASSLHSSLVEAFGSASTG